MGQGSLGLYALTVLIWGTTFYVVTFQVGAVPAEQSVLYRPGFYSMVALLLSTTLEGLEWSQFMLIGVAMILLGNVFVLRRRA